MTCDVTKLTPYPKHTFEDNFHSKPIDKLVKLVSLTDQLTFHKATRIKFTIHMKENELMPYLTYTYFLGHHKLLVASIW